MSYRWAGLSTTSTNTTRMSIILTGVSQNHGKYCYGSSEEEYTKMLGLW